jgi:hypothetical protein
MKLGARCGSRSKAWISEFGAGNASERNASDVGKTLKLLAKSITCQGRQTEVYLDSYGAGIV